MRDVVLLVIFIVCMALMGYMIGISGPKPVLVIGFFLSSCGTGAQIAALVHAEPKYKR